jgi:1-deoxy-D-xylulose-5-phosphate reductoisomerase
LTTKSISILGSTGSIGCSTLDLIEQTNENYLLGKSEIRFEIIALTANRAYNELITQAKKFRPKIVVLVDDTQSDLVKSELLPLGIEVLFGSIALNDAAAIYSDIVMAAIVGAAGLAPTLQAAKRGATILLANKEVLVCAGDLFMTIAKQNNAKVLPVDSEHNAIFQVLSDKTSVEKLILTASGGPFLHTKIVDLENVTPAQAIAHPNWQMGAKISVDCASMMNKGLELIEAAILFGFQENEIDVLVHPQSIIHSMVSYKDGSFLAQLGAPDMRIPISYCLNWPKRIETNCPRLNLAQIARLDFFEPDVIRFRALELARYSLKIGGNAPTILNAANEIAVDAFLNGKLKFVQIPHIVEKIMNQAQGNGNIVALSDLKQVFETDKWARAKALEELSL